MKIAIITNQPHNAVGGINTYNIDLIKVLLKNKYEVTLLITDNESKEYFYSSEKIPGVKEIWVNGYGKKDSNNLLPYVLSNKFDIVIDDSPTYNSKIFNNEKVIVVQHADYKEYWENCKIGYKIVKMFGYIFTKKGIIGNILKKSKNTFFFSNLHNIINKKNSSSALMPSPYNEKDFTPILKRSDKRVLWLGRFENSQKGVNHIIKINNIEKNRIKIAGTGKKEALVLKSFKDNFIGQLKREDVAKEIRNSSGLALTSNWEGFSYVLIEAVSLGIPIVYFDTFDGAKIYNEQPFAFPIKKGDYVSFSNTITKLNNMSDAEFKKLSSAAIAFSKKTFDQFKFEKAWIDYINLVHKKDGNHEV